MIKWLVSLIAGLIIFARLLIVPAVTTTASTIVEKNKNSQVVKVLYAIDGDTIVVQGNKKVRYIGINTSEFIYPLPSGSLAYECFAKEAYLKNKELVEGKTVMLVKDTSDTDKFDRLLRYVYVASSSDSAKTIFVNDYLVRQGYAKTMTIKPDIKYYQMFSEAQAEAEKNKIGLWKLCQSKN